MDAITPNEVLKKSKSTSKTAQVKTLQANLMRMQALVDAMITRMEQDFAAPAKLKNEGDSQPANKDTTIVNLQKLMQVIGLLTEQLEVIYPKKAVAAKPTSLSREEIDMLAEWLKAGGGEDG